MTTTIPALLAHHAAAHGDETILRKKDRGIWNAVTWTGLADRVREIGQGLRAAGLAVGGAVAIISQTRPDLVFTDLAILGCGGVSVAIDPDSDSDALRGVLAATNAAIAVVEDEEQLDKVLSVRAACPSLRRIVIVDMKGLREFQDSACISLADLTAGGAGQSDWAAAMAAVTPDQPAAIIAGQTLTHAGILRQVDAAARTLGVQPMDERLAVLPMSDPVERILGLYLALKTRMISNYLENPETATENLREVKPTVLGANTEAWERLHARIGAFAAAATPVQKALYRWAIEGGAGKGVIGGLANLLVLPAVRAHLGFGRLRVAYVGDAAVSPEIAKWAAALGIAVRQIDPNTQGGHHV